MSHSQITGIDRRARRPLRQLTVNFNKDTLTEIRWHFKTIVTRGVSEGIHAFSGLANASGYEWARLTRFRNSVQLLVPSSRTSG